MFEEFYIFEDWYKENIGSDTWLTFSYDDLKDAWEDAHQRGFEVGRKIGFEQGKDKGDHEV